MSLSIEVKSLATLSTLVSAQYALELDLQNTRFSLLDIDS